MKKALLMALAGLLCLSARAQNWSLVWSDEFNGAQLDQNHWNYETGTGVNGDFGTGQLDRATDRPENVAIEQGISGADGGALRITTRKEFYIDREYTSGRINTSNKVSYGPNHRIVARVWPQDVRYMGQGFAFWMMPDETPPGASNISWPQGGEVDIMEYVGSIPEYNLGSVHYAWDWNGNEWAEWNHAHHGGYYSFQEQEVQDSPEWLRVDLGSIQSVNRVVINWENPGKEYQVQTSTNGTDWTTVHSQTNGVAGIADITFGSQSARFVRMYGTRRSNAWGYSVYELEVYGSATGNLAQGRSATASSTQATDLPAGNAVDGSATTRWSSGTRNPDYQCCNPSSYTNPNVGANTWHEYGIDWFADRMEFHVDGNVYHIHYFNDGGAFAADGENQTELVVENGRNVIKSEFSNLYPEWHPFEHKMYMILSAGVGGGGQTYGGPIVDPAEFPVDVYIDWVRVYSNGEAYNPPPSVSMVAPSGVETYPAPASVTLTAAASDRDGGTVSSVSFYHGGQLIGTDNSAPFTYTWNNVAAGTYEVYAVATDNGGETGESQRVTVAVNGPGSNLALNRPGTASSVTGAFGPNLAFDADGTTKWESLYEDPQWVYVDLGNTYNIGTVNITWEPAYASNYEIQVSTDATNWQTIRTVTGNTSLSNSLTGLSGSGRYVRMYGTARGTAYGYSIYSMEVYGTGVANQSPTVSITAPANNSIFSPPASLNLTVDAADADGSVASVEFFNGGTSLGVDATVPFSWALSGLPEGTYTFTAKATDNLGATTTSSPVIITVGQASGCGGTNVALNQPAATSSIEGGYSAANAFDGDANTRWSSGFSDDEWLRVDLGSTQNICEVILTWEGAYGSDYEIRLGNSTDLNAATVIGTVSGGDGGTDVVATNAAISGRYLWMKGVARGTGWGYSLWELEVHAGSGSSNQAPTANAGADQTLAAGATSTTLSGSGTDADGDALSYSWTQTGGPAATLANANAASTAVSGLSGGNTYTFQLVVNDGTVNSAPDAVTITVPNQVSCTQNIALNKATLASSQEGAFGPANAVDGDGNSRWASNYADDEWLRIDLGGTYSICNVVLQWETAYGSDYEIRLGSTTDMNAATVIATVTGGDGGTDNVTTNASASGRYLWMRGLGRGTGWGYSLFELQVYGAGVAARSALQTMPSISLYPNPVEDHLHIRMEGQQPGVQVQIIAADGRVLLEQILRDPAATIDVSRLQPGLYFLRLPEARLAPFVKQ